MMKRKHFLLWLMTFSLVFSILPCSKVQAMETTGSTEGDIDDISGQPEPENIITDNPEGTSELPAILSCSEVQAMEVTGSTEWYIDDVSEQSGARKTISSLKDDFESYELDNKFVISEPGNIITDIPRGTSKFPTTIQYASAFDPTNSVSYHAPAGNETTNHIVRGCENENFAYWMITGLAKYSAFTTITITEVKAPKEIETVASQITQTSAQLEYHFTAGGCEIRNAYSVAEKLCGINREKIYLVKGKVTDVNSTDLTKASLKEDQAVRVEAGEESAVFSVALEGLRAGTTYTAILCLEDANGKSFRKSIEFTTENGPTSMDQTVRGSSKKSTSFIKPETSQELKKSYSNFSKKTIQQITRANEDETINIDFGDFNALTLDDMKQMAMRRDLNIKMQFCYNGIKYSVTFPTGMEIKYQEDIPYYGALKLLDMANRNGGICEIIE